MEFYNEKEQLYLERDMLDVGVGFCKPGMEQISLGMKHLTMQ